MPSAFGDGTERVPRRAGPRRLHRCRPRCCRPLNNENLYGFICPPGGTLFANRKRSSAIFRAALRKRPDIAHGIANPVVQKRENKISRRAEIFSINLAPVRAAAPKCLKFYDAPINMIKRRR